jgi:iron complex outermembrane receptor protein
MPLLRRKLTVAVLASATAFSSAPLRAAVDPPLIKQLKLLDVEQLLDIEVTSVARRPEKLREAAAAIQVITRSQIRRSGATTLAEALRLASNLQVAQRGARGWAITARGFNTDLANKLLVMIDGRTVYTPLFSGVFWEAQDYLLEDVDRIEVISGPGGSLWGANAVNGVINIITTSAAESQGLYAEAGGGSGTSNIQGLRYGGTLSPDAHFRVYGKHMGNEASALPDGSSAEDPSHRAQGGFRIDGARSADALTLQGDYYANRQRDLAGGGTTRMQGANLLGRWSRRLSAESDFVLQSYFDWTRFSDAVPPLRLGTTQITPPGQLRDDLKTVDLDFQHRFRAWGRHSITWGLGFRHTHDVVDNAPALAFLPAVLDQQLYSAFAQDEIGLGTGLSMTVGSKFERNEYTGLEVEPGIRLQWLPSSRQMLWGAVSRAIRAPSRIDRDVWQGPPPTITILKGSPDFQSEKVLAWELGHRGQFGTRISTSLSAFYNEYDDVRSTTITPVTFLPFYFANDLEGHTWGAEFTAGVQITSGWSLQAGYNWLEERLRVREGSIDISNGRNETADPEHQVSLRSALDLPGRMEFDAGLRWVGTLQNSQGPVAGTVPDYLDLDLRLAWHITNQLELSVAGRNLLHDQHPEYGFPSPTRPEVERNIYGKIAWRP